MIWIILIAWIFIRLVIEIDQAKEIEDERMEL